MIPGISVMSCRAYTTSAWMRLKGGDTAAEAYYRKAKFLLASGKDEEARELCKAAIEKFPSSKYIEMAKKNVTSGHFFKIRQN